MGNKFVNTASEAALDGNITAGATTAVLTTFTGWPASTPYWALIAGDTAAAEVVQVTGVAGSTVTIARGQGGTSASAHNTGDKFEHIIPAYTAELAESHAEATTAHGTSTAVVGTDDLQTLTQKTYEGYHFHQFSAAEPAGVAAGFKSLANSAAARDGFWHDSTSGDINRRAFYGTQSGSARYEVYNDGTVKITPSSAATRPGLAVVNDATDSALAARATADAQERVIVRSDGTIIWGSGSAVGDTNLYRVSADKLKTDDALEVGGALTALGTVTATGLVTANGGVSGTTVAASGAISGASVAATGAVSGASVAATGAVTGASSTISGAVSAGSLSVGGLAVPARPLYARKSTSEVITSATALQNDNDLFLALEANKDYHVSGILRVSGPSAADINIQWQLPSGATLALVVHAMTALGSTGADDQIFSYSDPTSAPLFGTDGNIRPIAFRGIVNMAGTAGNIQLRWSQNVSDPGSTTVWSNSHIIAEILN